jgi:hypothetical protein
LPVPHLFTWRLREGWCPNFQHPRYQDSIEME